MDRVNFMKNLIFMPVISIAMASLLFTQFAAADSQRLQWPSNKHFYKRFDNAAIFWNDAKKACEKQGAHLVTITSSEEQTFVYDQLVKPTSTRGFFMGANDQRTQGNFVWITGEPFFNYNNWYPGEPTNQAGRDYVAISRSDASWVDITSDGSSRWGDYDGGYICEWSANTFIASTRVPDINGNGAVEDAALYVNYKNFQHTVTIKDRKTKQVLKTLVYAASNNLPIGLVAIRNTNNNGKPEIAVLQANNTVTIKDIEDGATVRILTFFNNKFRPLAISVEPDQNGNKSDELTVLGENKSTNKASTQTKDSKTDKILNTTDF
jgi:Lectin C-type domain